MASERLMRLNRDSTFPSVLRSSRSSTGGTFSSLRNQKGLGEMVGVPSSAFTLIEVVLAIVIALGILVVLLFFYQQATNLRAQAIQATEQVAAARLVMDRITGELRAMVVAPSKTPQLLGTSNSIEFVRADVPSLSAWTGGALGRATVPMTDLRLMRYALETRGDSNVAGMFRSDAPLLQARGTATSTNSVNSSEVEPTNAVDLASASHPLVEEIRFLQFRYWAGTNWVDSWTSPPLPAGIEITLGSEPMTNGVESADSSTEIFRRVVYLPARELALNSDVQTNGSPSDVDANPSSEEGR